MYKTTEHWHPQASSAPCFCKAECNHHAETNGRCRETCSDFNVYKALRNTVLERKYEENIKEPIRRVRRYS